MALNIKQLNSDASFLLSFEPSIPLPSRNSIKPPRPFTILLDPWITCPTLFLPKSARTKRECITSLSDLPELDLVVISQHKSDHCNEATLRQLPASGKTPLILAEPSAARLIRSWRYFDPEKVVTLERWENPRLTGRQTAVRVVVPRVADDGQEGEVTVSFVPQRKKRDPAGLHGAIGITYRPPSIPSLQLAIPAPISLQQAQLQQQKKQQQEQAALTTPPTTPDSIGDQCTSRHPSATVSISDTTLRPPSPPISPRSLRSVQSAVTLLSPPSVNAQPQLYHPEGPNHHVVHQRMSSHDLFKASSHSEEQPYRGLVPSKHRAALARPLSVIFSPHGISYADLAPYATSHLVSEAALPLTALLHCMDSVASPPLLSIGQWFSSNNVIKGDICAGTPTGAEIAGRLAARVWVSAHDRGGERNEAHSLVAGGMLRTRTRRFARDEVLRDIGKDWDLEHSKKGSLMKENTRMSGSSGHDSVRKKFNSRGRGISETEAIRLSGGDELEVRADGVAWSSAGVGEWEEWIAGEKKEMEKERKQWEKEKYERIAERTERARKDAGEHSNQSQANDRTNLDLNGKTQGAQPADDSTVGNNTKKKQSLRTKASRIGFGILTKS